MRRKTKYIFYGTLIVGGGVALLDLLLQWSEHKENGIPFTWKSFDGLRTLKRTFFGAAIGGGIGYGYYRYKIGEEGKLPFDADAYLKKVLSEEHLKSDPIAFKKALAYREQMKQRMINTFGNKLAAPPEDTGSFIKRTAIASNYDLDIILPFRKDAYPTLSEMYYDVYEELGNEFGSKATITKYARAIGVSFETNGYLTHFDITPGREIDDYSMEKELNLYVKPEWVWQRGKSFKTRVGIQQTMTVNRPEARSVIKLLKAYSNRNGLRLPTLTVELCVVSALSENNFGVNASMTENLLNSMDFIAQKMVQKCLIDIANSNNNLHEKLDSIQRGHISDQLLHDIKNVEENPRYLKEIFEC